MMIQSKTHRASANPNCGTLGKIGRVFLSLVFVVGATTYSGGTYAEPKVYVRSNGQFVGNGNEYKRGFWVPVIQDAEELFKGNAEALEEYRLHVTDGKWFGILNWGALGLFITYTGITVANGNYQPGVGLLLFAVPWISGIVMGAKSNRHLLRAMNLINGVAPDQARGFSPIPAPPPAVAGLELESSNNVGRSRPAEAAILRVPLMAWTF